MDDFCTRLDKAELHLHLEGSIEPETIAELAPELSVAEARSRYAFTDFSGFLDAFKWVVGWLRSPDDYALAARRLFSRLEAENVRYAEVTLSVGVLLWKKMDAAAVYEAVAREAARSRVDVWWTMDAIRHFGADHAWQVARIAAEHAGSRVVSFGIGGDEARGPMDWFGEVFSFAKQQGLRVVPHAGETLGAEAVWAAMRAGADRIGHGIGAAADPDLMRELRERDLALEVCPSSNVRTGAVAGWDAHPLRVLFDAGVPVVLNTDDPAMFGCTLSGEYRAARDRFGLSEADLRQLAANGFRYGFRSADRNG